MPHSQGTMQSNNSLRRDRRRQKVAPRVYGGKPAATNATSTESRSLKEVASDEAMLARRTTRQHSEYAGAATWVKSLSLRITWERMHSL